MVSPNAPPTSNQPPSIKVKLGDSVRVSFNLKFNRQLVEQRPDRNDYRVVHFRMTADAEGKQEEGGGNNGVPRDIKVTTDDQAIDVTYVFDNVDQASGSVRAGDVWRLEMLYTNEDGTSPGSPRRTFKLATVTIDDGKAPGA